MLWSERRPVDPGNHRFVGFTEEDHLAGLLGHNVQVGVASPEIALHRDVLYSPPDLFAPDIWATGGLMTASGDLIPLVRTWRTDYEDLLGLTAPAAREPLRVIEGDVVYLGWLFDAFGHLVLESLARVWALDLLPPTIPVLFHYWPNQQPPERVLEWLAIFGIGRERILIPEGPVLFRDLLIPDPMHLITSLVHEHAGLPFRAAARRITGDALPCDQPVYFSRTNLPATQRAIAGEAALEAVLRDNGFLIVHPETLSAAEQIRIAASHRTLVACKGGAAELFAFASPGSTAHLLCARPALEVNLVVSGIAGIRAVYHNVLRWRGSPLAAARLALDEAIAGLAADGLLPDLSRAPYLPGDADLDADFDELWLYGILTRHMPLDAEVLALAEPLVPSLRPTAWPVFAALAAHMPDARLSPAQADALMTFFTDALIEEPDANRRWRYAAQVRDLAGAALARCTPPVQTRARDAIAAQLP
ncbi:MAG: glycosyltransferase family 61 protein [Chloroflexota bacterium]